MFNNFFWIVPSASILALIFAYVFFKQVMLESEGNAKMIKIASHVRKGAMAYLKQQYKVVSLVFIVLTILFVIMALFNLRIHRNDNIRNVTQKSKNLLFIFILNLSP